MNINFLIGTLSGAIIGGITNGIAIKMLFRPLNPVKIGNYTLPFTPGVIPKERKRIANKVGEVISQELLNEEVLRTWFLKEEVYESIEKIVDDYLQAQASNEKSVEQLIEECVGKDRSTYLVCELEEQVTYKLYSKIISMELGKIVVEKIQDAFKEGSFGSLLGPMSFLINDSLIESIGSKMEPVITQFILDEGESVIRKAVEEETHQLLDRQIKEVIEKAMPYNEFIKRGILKGYKNFIENHTTGLLKVINIQKIVEERILSLDMLEVERMILSIMHKELNAIIWLGVLLGAIMGTISSFI